MERTTSPLPPKFPSPPQSATVFTEIGWPLDSLDLMLEWLSAVDDLHALAARLEVADRRPRR